MAPLASFGAALATVSVLTALTLRLSPALGLAGEPSWHRARTNRAPRVGGIAIYATLLLFLLLSDSAAEHIWFLGSALLLLGIGLYEDIRGKSVYLRLGVQAFAVATLVIGGGSSVADLGRLAPNGDALRLGWLALPFTVIIGVVFINAYKISDALNGLCSGLVAAATGGLILVVAVTDQSLAGTQLMLALLGGAIGFTMFNLHYGSRLQSLASLGNSGAYVIAFALFYLLVDLSQGDNRYISPAAALWFAALPLLDMAVMASRRVVRGRSLLVSERERIHHIFLVAKCSPSETLLVLVSGACIGILVGVVGSLGRFPDIVLLLTFVLVGIMYYWMIRRAWQMMKFLRYSIDRRARVSGRRRSSDDRRWEGSADETGDERRSGSDRRKGRIDRRQPPR